MIAEIGDMMNIQVIIEGSMNSSNPYFSSSWRRNFFVSPFIIYSGFLYSCSYPELPYQLFKSKKRTIYFFSELHFYNLSFWHIQNIFTYTSQSIKSNVCFLEKRIV